jgi:hypothetical protein
MACLSGQIKMGEWAKSSPCADHIKARELMDASPHGPHASDGGRDPANIALSSLGESVLHGPASWSIQCNGRLG